MVEIYHYDFCRQREKLIEIKFNEKFCGLIDMDPCADFENFSKDWAKRLVCDKWISGFHNRFSNYVPDSVKVSDDIETPESVVFGHGKL